MGDYFGSPRVDVYRGRNFQQFLNTLFNDVLRTYEVSLAFDGAKISNATFVRS